jgi:aspartate racemase
VLIPPDGKRGIVNDVIFNGLCLGVIKPSSRDQFMEIIRELVARGAEGIISGCTEIPMLIKQGDCPVPLLDTTSIHAVKAVDYALG